VAVLPFPHVAVGPTPESGAHGPITQRRLQDLADRIAEWRCLGESISELGAGIIADIADGQRIEHGSLKFMTETTKHGTETVYSVSVE
jgi:hypothetical protein